MEKGRSGPKPRKKDAPVAVPLAPSDRIEPPRWLDNYGREEWFTYIEELMESGVITNRDVAAFAQLCICLGVVRRCAEIIELRSGEFKPDKNGEGDSALSHAYGTRPIPELKTMMQAQDKAFKIMHMFGMMPGSRRKLGNVPKGKPSGKLTATEDRRLRLFGVPD